MRQVLRGGLVVLQSILAVALGAVLFLAFDELWKWNNIVALVLSVLVILGLVVAVRILRKTEDVASTLIAVVVGCHGDAGPACADAIPLAAQCAQRSRSVYRRPPSTH